MLARPQNGAVAIVVEESELGAPCHHHGETRGQHNADRSLQAQWPRLRRTQGRLPPVGSAYSFAHFSSSEEKVGRGTATRISRQRHFPRALLSKTCRPIQSSNAAAPAVIPCGFRNCT